MLVRLSLRLNPKKSHCAIAVVGLVV